MRTSSVDNHVHTFTGFVGLVVLTFIALATAPLPARAANEVGAIPGSFAVSSTGAATYSIPISLPPGAAGLMPHLALTYNSQSGNGLAGYGWTLSGLSAITVCKKTWAQDGTNTGVSFAGTSAAANDFCLDGNKLVLASGTLGAKDSTYRKEVDDFSKITAYTSGSTGPAATTGPQYFTVQTSDGLTYEYGGTADSEIVASGPGIASGVTVVRAWALDEIRDAYGNAVKFSYQQDTTNGDYWPVSINYTAHYGTTGTHTVSFSYDNLASINAGLVWQRYEAGALISRTKRLHSITVATSGATTFTYTLAYDTTLTDGNGHTGTERSRLKTVTECAGGVCYPATSIGWQSGTSGWGSQVGFGQASDAAHASAAKLIDVDGDGYLDLVFPGTTTWKWVRGTANGLSATSVHDTLVPVGVYQSAIAFDYFGAGRMGWIEISPDTGDWEIVAYDPNNIKSPWTVYTTNLSSTTTAPSLAVADYNGDGLEDLVYKNSNGLYVAENKGGSFAPSITLNSTTGDGALSGAGFEHQFVDDLMDFDGDGRTDIFGLRVYTQPCNADSCPPNGPSTFETWHVREAQATGYVTVASLSGDADVDVTEPLPVDFNGDGLSDLAYAKSGFSGTGYAWFAGVSNGFNLIAENFSDSSAPSYDPNAVDYIGIADYSGNGRQSIMQRTANGTWGLLGYRAGQLQSSYDTAVNVPGAICSGSFRTGDMNGDGLSDLVWASKNSDGTCTWYYRPHLGQAPDLVHSITNNFGQQYAINYHPLTDGPDLYKENIATPSFPTQLVQPALQVVASYTANDGVAGTYTKTYSYSDAEIDLHGRGFLGFADVTQTTNYGADTETTDTTYNQAFPETGYPASVTSSINNLTQRVTNYTYSDKTTVGTAKYVYANKMVVQDYDKSDQSTPYRTVTTDTAPTLSGGVITKLVTTVTTSPATVTSTTTTNFDVDTSSNWCLLLPSSVTVSNTGAGTYGAQLSRSMSYVNDTTHCQETNDSVNISTTAGSQKVETNYAYDPTYGNLQSKTVTGTNIDSSQETRETSYTYDSTNTFVKTTAADPSGFNLVTSGTWDPALGVVTSQTAPDGGVTQFTYDTFGVKTSETLPDGTSITWDRTSCSGCGITGSAYKVVATHYSTNHTAGATSTGYYDMDGRVLLQTTPVLDGSANDLTTSNVATQYDDMGRVSQVSSPYTSAAQAWTYRKYDNFGRVSEVDTPASVSASKCSAGICATSYSYTLDSNTKNFVTTVKDPNGNSTSKTVDAVGRVTQMTDAKGKITAYSYDPFGDLREVDTPGGVTTTMTYDGAGRKTGMTDPDMGTWSYKYDALGELLSQTDAKGQTTTQTYDSLGRLHTRSDSVSGTRTWTYGTSGSNNGHLISEQGADGYLKSLQYDSIGRPSEVDVQINGGTTYASTTTYDSYGHVQSVTYPETPTAVADDPPVAATNGNQVVVVNQHVTLDASSSYDPDNGPQPLTYTWSQISGPANMGVDGSTSSQVSLTPSVTGTYEFLVTVSDGESIASAPVTIAVKPAQVGTLSASAVNTSTGVFTLSWPTTAGAKLYQLERAVGSGSYNLSSTTYTGTSAPLTERTDGTYHYGIQGCSDADTNGDRVCGDWSATLPVSITLAPAKPATPTTSPSGTTTGTYKVYWTAPTTTATGTKPVTISNYKLFRAVGNGSFSSVTNEGTALSSATFNDNNGAYYYELEACNSSCSAVSGVVRIIVDKPTPIVSLSPVGGTGSTLLSWHVTNGVSASSYTLQTAPDSSFTSPTTVYSGSATSYTVNPGVATHYFRVRGYNSSSGWGAWSNTSTITGTCKVCGTATTLQLNSTLLASAPATTSDSVPADNSASAPAVVSAAAPNAVTASDTRSGNSMATTRPQALAGTNVLTALRQHALQMLASRSDPAPILADRVVGPKREGIDTRAQLAALDKPNATAPHLVRAVATATSTSRYAVNYVYDAHEHLIEVVDAANPNLIYWQATSGNAFGEVNGELLGNTVISTRSYDPGTGQLLNAQTGVGGSTALMNTTYTWDGDGNLQTRTDNNANLTETFSYDQMNRLTEADTSGSQTRSLVYQYDDIGNLTSRTDSSDPADSLSYAYNTAGQPLELSSVTPGSGGVRSFSYDADGNLVSDGVHTYTWNVQNQPTQITDGGVTTTFSYTPDGARYQEVMTDGEVLTEISPLFQIETDAGGVTTYKESILAGDGIVAIRAIRQDGLLTTRYLTHDHLGSVNTVTDEAGTLKEQFSYDAFGQQRNPTTWAVLSTPGTSLATDKGYTGQQQLNGQMAALNLIHMNGRVYDPEIGRFVSADPTVPDPLYSQSFNRYAYVYNNPLSMVDPSGFDPCPSKGDSQTDKKKDGSGSGHNCDPETGSHIRGVNTGATCSGNCGGWGSMGPGTGSPKENGSTAQPNTDGNTPAQTTSAVLPPVYCRAGGSGDACAEAVGYVFSNYLQGLIESGNTSWLPSGMSIETFNDAVGVGAGYLEFTNRRYGQWKGLNGKWNSLDWGGNGWTGPRSSVTGIADFGKALGEGTFALSLYYGGRGYFDAVSAGDYSEAQHQALNVVMAGVGVEGGPPGWVASGVYFGIDYTIGWDPIIDAGLQTPLNPGLSNEWIGGWVPAPPSGGGP